MEAVNNDHYRSPSTSPSPTLYLPPSPPHTNLGNSPFEERLLSLIRLQIHESLKQLLPQHLMGIKADIKSLQDSVNLLKAEFSSFPPSSIDSPQYTQTLQSPFPLTSLDPSPLEESSLPSSLSRLRTIEDEKKFKDYCREAARLCLDLSKPWTSQKPSSKKEATKLVVEHTGASEEEAQNRFKKYLTHIKSYQKKTKAAAERGNVDFIISGKRHSRSPPFDHQPDDHPNKRHCLDDLEKDYPKHPLDRLLLHAHGDDDDDDDLNRLGN